MTRIILTCFACWLTICRQVRLQEIEVLSDGQVPPSQLPIVSVKSKDTVKCCMADLVWSKIHTTTETEAYKCLLHMLNMEADKFAGVRGAEHCSCGVTCYFMGVLT